VRCYGTSFCSPVIHSFVFFLFSCGTEINWVYSFSIAEVLFSIGSLHPYMLCSSLNYYWNFAIRQHVCVLQWLADWCGIALTEYLVILLRPIMYSFSVRYTLCSVQAVCIGIVTSQNPPPSKWEKCQIYHHQICCFFFKLKMHKNPFSARAPSWTLLGSLQCSTRL